VLFYLASHLAVAELAHQLSVSPNTVKTQMKGIYRTLEVSSRDAATERARALGLR
jgi:LuxR family maltose regulon positive regulatory protein